MYDVLVRIYGRLVIVYKRMTIGQVPEQYRADVQKWIDEQPDWYKAGY